MKSVLVTRTIPGGNATCGSMRCTTGLHRVDLRLKWAFSSVTAADGIRYAIDFCAPENMEGADAEQAEADVAAAERALLAKPEADGHVLLDDETYASVRRLLQEATEYARLCGYGSEDNDTEVEALAGSETGLTLVCWGDL